MRFVSRKKRFLRASSKRVLHSLDSQNKRQVKSVISAITLEDTMKCFQITVWMWLKKMLPDLTAASLVFVSTGMFLATRGLLCAAVHGRNVLGNSNFAQFIKLNTSWTFHRSKEESPVTHLTTYNIYVLHRQFKRLPYSDGLDMQNSEE